MRAPWRRLLVVAAALRGVSAWPLPPVASLGWLNETTAAGSEGRRGLSEVRPHSRIHCEGARASNGQVVYFHIFKAAGSTVRSVLRGFADQCGVSLVILIQCGAHGGDPLVHGDGTVDCEVKDSDNLHARLHAGKAREAQTSLNALERAQIIGGHLDYSLVSRGHFSSAALVTVLREPVSAFVSGLRYHADTILRGCLGSQHRKHHCDGLRAHTRLHGIVTSAVRDVGARNQTGKLVGNAVLYLSAHGKTNHPTDPSQDWERVRESIGNLGTFSVVGLVENFEVSMTLFQRFLDPEHTFKQWHPAHTKNSSPDSFGLADVLAKLPNATRSALDSALAGEHAIYAAALEAHARTCSAVGGKDLAGADRLACACERLGPGDVVCTGRQDSPIRGPDGTTGGTPGGALDETPDGTPMNAPMRAPMGLR
mmetsp:Transcript_67041/g.131487  ORF Transcript_67041/g.131487 Transcript_67041/m.131487 type:complete len:425 (-) Transcript_67041:7-1281(-)